MSWRVEVSVHGGPTGSRYAWLKSKGTILEYPTQDQAQQRAREYRETPRPHASATFNARAVDCGEPHDPNDHDRGEDRFQYSNER